MKKRILSTLALGALLAGGAASAQGLPSEILGAILGGPGWAGDASGTFSHREGDRPYEIQRDSNGRAFYYDRWRNVIYVDNGYPAQNAYGVGVPYAYGAPQPYATPSRRDRDGDGVRNRYDRDRDGDGIVNRYDRRPNDPRRR